MLGLKIQKPLQDNFLIDSEGNSVPNTAPNTLSKYSECARWCNENKAVIEDRGDFYEVVPTPEPSKEILADQIRCQRDGLIADTDYLLAPDYPISPEDLEAVKVYRQELRDVPQQEGFPEKVTFPEKPVIQKL